MARMQARRGRRGAMVAGAWALAAFGGLIVSVGWSGTPPEEPTVMTPLVVLGANDLGMHCMQQDFSEFLILPPFNTVHAQVIDRSGEHPRIVTENVTVEYTIPGNTRSTDKTNWWSFDQMLLGVDAPADIGLTGNGLAGQMFRVQGENEWAVTGIPVTPIDDDGRENPYPLATITVRQGSQIVARTQTVVPVSWEINCNLCHSAPGISAGLDILRDHDRLHGTTLELNQPVFCAGCHADPALGAPGQTGISTFSSAMHAAHAPRMGQIDLENSCYACHPGIRTQCQRDVHFARGVNCIDCHGDMAEVGDPARRPWVDEPRCADCHTRQGFEFEQPGNSSASPSATAACTATPATAALTPSRPPSPMPTTSRRSCCKVTRAPSATAPCATADPKATPSFTAPTIDPCAHVLQEADS